MPRIALLLTLSATAASPVLAQVPAVGQASTKQIEESLDRLVDQIDSARYKAIETRKRLAVAETPEERAALVKRVQALGEQLQSLTKQFIEATGSMRQQVDPLRAKIRKALEMEDLKASASALKALLKDNEQSPLVGLIHFSLGGTLRLRAEAIMQSSRNDTQAELLMLDAVKSYERAKKAPKLSDPEIGTSVRAASARHIVQIYASLFDGYRDLAEQAPRVVSYAKKRDRYGERGRAAVRYLRRFCGEDRLADGRLVIDVVSEDVRRLTGGR